jgi:hypothetical protein
MSVDQQKLISYLRKCYQADNREMGLMNVFSDKIEQKLVFEEADLLEGTLPIYPVPKQWGEKVKEVLAVYSKEKEVFINAFFIRGKTLVAGKEVEVVAPLLMIPAHLEEREDFYLSLDFSRTIVNRSIFRFLCSEEDDNLLINLLYGTVLGNPIDFNCLGVIRSILTENFSNLHTDEVLMYPQLFNKHQIKNFLIDQKGQFSLLPGIVAGIHRKSSSTIGVLNELKDLEKANSFSRPLNEFLGVKADKGRPEAKGSAFVPVTLNLAQESVFESVRRNDTTLVVGPPGTGKSFTIAALAVDYIAKGKSVLVVSSNKQAVDVVADKLELDLGLKHVTVRGGKRDYKRSLIERLTNLLNGIGLGVVDQDDFLQHKKILGQELKLLSKLETKFKHREIKELRRGAFFARYETHFFDRIKKWFIDLRINSEMPYWDLIVAIEGVLGKKNELVKTVVVDGFQLQLENTLINHRNELQKMLSAIKSRIGSRKEEIFKQVDFKQIQKTFPVWLVEINEVSKLLPMTKGLFDMVIIDEASQCDLASILPVLFRAKKIVVCGDPKQLRHLSFLAKSRQNQIGTALSEFEIERFDFRNRSVLDLVNDTIATQDQVVLLNEHYRSKPAIIDFSNHEFYGGALKIMTSSPLLNSESDVELIVLEGKRNGRGVNEVESDYIFSKIKQVVLLESQSLNPSSIGVLSPFRDQVSHLQKRVMKEFTLHEIERHHLLIGTAYEFQGEEREVMFLSFTLDEFSHPTAFRYLNKLEVFNVSITRAKRKQYVLTSIHPNKVDYNSLLGRYFSSFTNKPLYKNNENEFHEVFLDEVRQLLITWSCENIHVSFNVAGLSIDLLVVKESQIYCIDLVGYPGIFQGAFSVERYKMLHRVNMKVFPLPFSSWREQRSKTEKALNDFLNISS